MDLFIGIAGGHQSSSAIAIGDGSEVVCVTGERINLHTQHPDQAGEHISRMLKNISSRLGLRSMRELIEVTKRFTLALPGLSTTYDEELARMAVTCAGYRSAVQFFDDTWAGLLAGALREDGICAVANSGASVFAATGRSEGEWFKFDGWGPVIGDLGSGFDLSQQMFQRLSRNRDLGIESQLLERLLLRLHNSGAEHAADIQKWFDDLCRDNPFEWRYAFAALADVATETAKLGDPESVSLVEDAANRLADTISIALRRFPQLVKYPVCCQGGMFEHSDLYTNTIRKRLLSDHDAMLELARYKPLVGCLLMSLSGGYALPPQLELDRVLHAIDVSTDRPLLKYEATSQEVRGLI